MPVRVSARRLRRLVSALALVALTCALPGAAYAAEYTVDSTLDEADDNVGAGSCHTAGNNCTLRAAIQESNFSTGVKDTIKFKTPDFNGELADTIPLGPSFPSITDPVTIDGDGGGQCATAAGVSGPCVGVSGPGGGFGLQVNADGVTIEGLAVTGALTGINVINASENLIARDNWLGVKLDGTAGANNTGLFLDPGSDGATIGGTAATDRNVFANNNNEGLDIEGASEATVLGNYFGVAPNGSTQAANAKDIEVTDSTSGGGFEAANNEIGDTIEGPEFLSTPCDGGCNLISGATSTGLDLAGNGAGQNEAPASGPTTVHGNYVGPTAAGTAVTANGTFDILVGAADEAMIGGLTGGDANWIAGGAYGVYAENANSLEVLGNMIGFSRFGGPLTPPSEVGMFIFCLSVVDPAKVSGNSIQMVSGVGIEHRFTGAEITENVIIGGQYGLRTLGSTDGNLIQFNSISNASANGILIENDLNEVLHNSIFESGGAGVRIQNPAPLVISTGNRVGGDTPAEENKIFGNAGGAVQIVDNSGASEDSENEVARNVGPNSGLFIDLVGNANGGIKPPVFSAATQSGASGSGAEAGATIRVFSKVSASPGEIDGFLAEATADGGGNWKVSYPASISAGTAVAATQTSVAGGTSELAFASTASPSGGGGSGGGGGNGGNGNGNDNGKAKGKKGSADVKPPQTTIRKGPKAKTHATSARFKFSSSEPGSNFECKLDRKPFRPCRPGKRYAKLKPGKHVFKVRAIDSAGNVDKSPAKRKFRVLAAG